MVPGAVMEVLVSRPRSRPRLIKSGLGFGLDLVCQRSRSRSRLSKVSASEGVISVSNGTVSISDDEAETPSLLGGLLTLPHWYWLYQNICNLQDSEHNFIHATVAFCFSAMGKNLTKRNIFGADQSL